jgi:uncharacterized membrane protein
MLLPDPGWAAEDVPMVQLRRRKTKSVTTCSPGNGPFGSARGRRATRRPLSRRGRSARAVYAFLDFARSLPLGLLAAAFALLVVVVARLRGLFALISLAIAFATIAYFVLPALRHHENPVLVAGVGATAIISVILYLTHGFSTKTSTALLGTVP